LAFDVGSVAAMMAAGIFYWNNFAGVNMVMDIAFFSVYCFFQGAVMTGIWMLGHECGHGAFSDSKSLNDTVGLFLHSYLLTPFFSW
jgi:omega-6 fatty acid desaturase (delta-12 desaturase)